MISVARILAFTSDDPQVIAGEYSVVFSAGWAYCRLAPLHVGWGEQVDAQLMHVIAGDNIEFANHHGLGLTRTIKQRSAIADMINVTTSEGPGLGLRHRREPIHGACYKNIS